MRKIVLFLGVMMLLIGCSNPFIIKPQDNAEIVNSFRKSDNSKPEWVGKEYWGRMVMFMP